MALVLLALICLSPALILLTWRFVYRNIISGTCTSSATLTNKIAIVTGANSGIGKETAFDLAKRGAKVILACRNLQSAQKVSDWINNSLKRKASYVLHLDLGDLDSVRKFCEIFLEKENKLHILVNNAGKGIPERCSSPQGLELCMAINYFGPFLLTNILLGILKATGDSRIVNVSSIAHKTSKLDFDDLQYEKRKYGGFTAYAQSKLCIILFTTHLAKLLKGKGITVNSVHPGFCATNIANHEGTLLGKFITLCLQCFGKDSKLGAQTTLHLAVSEKVNGVSGKYFVDCQVARPSKLSQDFGVAKKLWELSEQSVKLKKQEKHF